MIFTQTAILSMSVSVGAVIGWIRLKKTDPAFTPFILLLTLGFVHELGSLALINMGYTNALTYNLFTLAEACLVSLQFYAWGLFKKQRVLYGILFTSYFLVWLTENSVKGFFRFNSYFIILYSFITVLGAILMINKLIVSSRGNLFRNAVFLICTGVIFYFTFSALVETFWAFGLNRSSFFRNKIYSIHSYVNLFSNVLYAYAVLWIPMKRQYIMQS